MRAIADEMAARLISIAEKMFGPMDSDWAYRGVEFSDQSPHLAYYPEVGAVAISLSLRTLDDEAQFCFQLAHEVCHLLCPAGDVRTGVMHPTTVINEGVSTYFSIFVLNEMYGGEAANSALRSLEANSSNYFAACMKVGELLQRDRDAVMKLRKIQPKINNIARSDFHAAGLPVADEEIAALLADF